MPFLIRLFALRKAQVRPRPFEVNQVAQPAGSSEDARGGGLRNDPGRQRGPSGVRPARQHRAGTEPRGRTRGTRRGTRAVPASRGRGPSLRGASARRGVPGLRPGRGRCRGTRRGRRASRGRRLRARPEAASPVPGRPESARPAAAPAPRKRLTARATPGSPRPPSVAGWLGPQGGGRGERRRATRAGTPWPGSPDAFSLGR